jgi:ABC-type iron transport system FetAB ATPase subunit
VYFSEYKSLAHSVYFSQYKSLKRQIANEGPSEVYTRADIERIQKEASILEAVTAKEVEKLEAGEAYRKSLLRDLRNEHTPPYGSVKSV